MNTNCVAAVLSALLIALAGCSSHGKAEAEDSAAAPVQVATVKKQSMERSITVSGILYPRNQASIVPKISAPVARFLVQRGDHVHQGQVIAILEHQDLAAAAQESEELYDQAQASLRNTTQGVAVEDRTKAQADVAVAKQGLDAAQKLYDNRLQLVREGALAQKLVDDARVALVQAQSTYDTAAQHLQSLESVSAPEQIKSAQAQAAAAKAHYQGAAAQAGYAEVRSPIAGVVADRSLNVGEMASSGSALATIVDLSRVVARTNVPVDIAAALKVGDKATIAEGDQSLDGKVTVVSPAVDPNTTTVQVWVEAANAEERLKPGSTVQVSIQAGVIPDALVVPASALLNGDEGGVKVMLAGSDGLAHESDVTTGVRTDKEVQIVEGVKEGDRVITQGALGLDDKAKIQVVGAGQAGAGSKDE